VLVLSDCQLSIQSLMCLHGFQLSNVIIVFPGLQELFLARNRLNNVPIQPDSAVNLRVLDLDHNPLLDFTHLWSLSSLPNLESLSVNDCSLRRIEFDQPVGFIKLNILSIKDNHIVDWSCVESLTALYALQRLSMKGNPLPSPETIDSRELIIALIPRLIEVDRCEVSGVERRSAELRALDRRALTAFPQALSRMLEKYGQAETIPICPSRPLPLLRLRFVYGDKSVERSLPASMTIEKVLAMAIRLRNVDISQGESMKLFYAGGTNERRLLDNPLRNLDFYEIRSGEDLLISINGDERSP